MNAAQYKRRPHNTTQTATLNHNAREGLQRMHLIIFFSMHDFIDHLKGNICKNDRTFLYDLRHIRISLVIDN